MIRYMRTLMSTRNDEGASAVEYGLLIAAIAAVIVIIVFALGGVIKNVFGKTCSTISSQTPVSGNCSDQ
jgi:pilus assembly protein Flp/PilA